MIVSAPTPDIRVPSLARAWDYLLDGKDHFQVDRRAVDQMIDSYGGWRPLARMQRRFVGRAVRYLVGEAGVRQMIDIGCGFPTRRNVHDIAQEIDPDVRVLSIDNDPVVLAHSRALVADDRKTAALLADVSRPGEILEHPLTRRLLDLDQPYAVLLCGVLHHVRDEQNPIAVTEQFKSAMPVGSYLVVSNFLGNDNPRAAEAERAFDKAFGTHATARFRTWAEQLPYLAGLDSVEPGLVYADDWRPDEHIPDTSPEHTLLCAGVGRIPA